MRSASCPDVVTARARFAELRGRSIDLVAKSKALRERSARLRAESQAELEQTFKMTSARATRLGAPWRAIGMWARRP